MMVTRNVAKTRSYGTEPLRYVAYSFVWGEPCLLQPRADCVWFLWELQGALSLPVMRTLAPKASEHFWSIENGQGFFHQIHGK